jgi:hypothetical protein
MTTTHSTTIKNIEIRWGYLYSAIATVIASGLLLAKTPPIFYPYVEALVGLLVAFHPSPVSITPRDAVSRLGTFLSTVEPLVPAKDMPIVEDAVALARGISPVLTPEILPKP